MDDDCFSTLQTRIFLDLISSRPNNFFLLCVNRLCSKNFMFLLTLHQHHIQSHCPIAVSQGTSYTTSVKVTATATRKTNCKNLESHFTSINSLGDGKINFNININKKIKSNFNINITVSCHVLQTLPPMMILPILMILMTT